MTPRRFCLAVLAIPSLAALFIGCKRTPSSSRRALAQPQASGGITIIDARDTAAYAEAGPAAIAAVARCHPPACRPDIFRGPGTGELTVGLDSSDGSASRDERQWHLMPDLPPYGGQAFQDSGWAAMLTRWEAAKPRRLLLIDGVPRTYAYARGHVGLSSVWGIQEVSATEAKTLSSDPDAANGAIAITTKAHAPSARLP